MYITITNDKTIKSTPSLGVPGEDTGEKETEACEEDAEPEKNKPEVNPQIQYTAVNFHCLSYVPIIKITEIALGL